MVNKIVFRLWLLVLVAGGVCLHTNTGHALPNSLEEAASSLEQGLDQLEQLLAKMEWDLSRHEPVSLHMKELTATIIHLGQLIQGMEAGFASFEENIPSVLKDEALQQLARRRQAETKTLFEQRQVEAAVVISRLSQLRQVPNGEWLATIRGCRQALQQLVHRQHNPLDINNLPMKRVSWENNSPPVINTPKLPSLPTPEDLVSAPKSSPGSSIVQLAKTLDHDPLKIYRWVKDNTHYLPLFGSIKGVQRCLWDREGSDFDQAALLVALLRAAKIPARYVYGQMSLPLETAAEWLGVEDPLAAQTILRRGGIPYQNGVIRRVWVKAYVDNTWLEMDPAFKHSGWENNVSVDEQLSWVELPADEREELEAALGVSLLARGSLAAGQKRRLIKPSLSNDLSPSILLREWEAIRIPPEFQYWLRVELGPVQGKASLCSAELPMDQALSQPLSLLYLPADKQDAKLMEALMLQQEDTADKGIGYLPSYLVRVRPHLLFGDRVIARGEPVCLGAPQYLSLSFNAPLQPVAPVRHMIVAGTQASLGLNMGNMSLESLNNLRDESAAAGLAQRLARHLVRLWNEELGLGVFKDTALVYHQQNTSLVTTLAQTNGVYAVPFMGEALIAQSAQVACAFDIPVSFRYSGVNFDLQRNGFVLTPMNNNPGASNQFLAQTGVYGTILEHRVLEQMGDKRLMPGEAVSAVRTLLLAKTQGVPLLHLTRANSGPIWSQLQISHAIVQDIEAAISQGYEVVLPQQEIVLNDWQGLGYIIRHTETGAGAYLISGGLAGGSGIPSGGGRGRGGSGTSSGGGTGFRGTGSATTKLSMGMPRGFWAKILVLLLVLAAVVAVAAL